MMLIGMGLFRAGFLTGKLSLRTYGIIALLGYGIGVPLGIVMVRETMRSGFDVPRPTNGCICLSTRSACASHLPTPLYSSF
jgi:hypothetical protein